jgi:predicted nucleotidyltransferase
MSVETFEALEKAIKKENILKKYKLEKIGIFGSFARGETANDIDFYVGMETYDLKNIIGLKNDLEKIINVKLIEIVFEIEEINLSRDSKYYTNVRFEKVM